jgi:hypothetical protein
MGWRGGTVLMPKSAFNRTALVCGLAFGASVVGCVYGSYDTQLGERSFGGGGAGGTYYVGGGSGYAAYGGRSGFDAGGRDGGDAIVGDAQTDATPGEAGDAEAAKPAYCANPTDCGNGFTCGPDGTCHPGDCSVTQCINGFVCELSANGQVCNLVDPRACTSDAECGGTDACVNGTCVAASWLCSDRTQCLSGSVCVDGKCVVACGVGDSCPDGYLCQKESRLCNIVELGCAITADCGSPYVVCVDHACVPRCSVQGPCGEGLGFCVNNGCIPSQKIVAQCAGEGVQAGCASGQICLHQHCYTSCAAPDAGVAEGGVGACTEGPEQDACKTITTAGGAYAVCGSTSNLGAECDLTVDKSCALGQICIDGFCRPGI